MSVIFVLGVCLITSALIMMLVSIYDVGDIVRDLELAHDVSRANGIVKQPNGILSTDATFHEVPQNGIEEKCPLPEDMISV